MIVGRFYTLEAAGCIGVIGVNNSNVHEFLQSHFLHWLEALSLMGKMSEAVLMIKVLDVIPGVRTNWVFLCVLDADPFNF